MTDAKYGICNNFGQALFRQITLQEGDIEMNNSTGTYPYHVDFENRVPYDERDLEGRPRLEGCIADTASKTAVARPHATQATQNAGLFARSALFHNGKRVQVSVKPHLGPLAQTRYLLPKTRITFTVIPNSDSFLLTHDPAAAKKTYGVYIKRIILRVRTVKVEPQRAATRTEPCKDPRQFIPLPPPSCPLPSRTMVCRLLRKILVLVVQCRNYDCLHLSRTLHLLALFQRLHFII